MIKVNSTVKLNMAAIGRLSKAQIVALEQTAEALHGEVKDAQVIPMKTGNLTGEAFFCDYSKESQGKATLVHNAPYARRLYFHPEYHFNKKFHENAKGKWFEDWADPPDGNGRRSKSVREKYKEIYRRIAGL